MNWKLVEGEFYMNVTDVEFGEFLVWNKFFKPKDALTIVDVGANIGQSVDLYFRGILK